MQALTTAEIRHSRLREPVNRGLVTFAALWPKTGQNLGTLARTADALNASMVIPSDAPARRALKKGNTIGTHNTIVTLVDDVQRWLKAQTGRIVGVELAAGAIRLADLSVTDVPAIVLLGHENSGIPPWALALCSDVVEIPMFGVGNSLNVAVAGSLVGYKLAGLT